MSEMLRSGSQGRGEEDEAATEVIHKSGNDDPGIDVSLLEFPGIENEEELEYEEDEEDAEEENEEPPIFQETEVEDSLQDEEQEEFVDEPSVEGDMPSNPDSGDRQ